MLYKQLSQRHPSLDPNLAKRYDALYRGGPAFRAMLGDFLPKNPLEGPSVYQLRKKEARYKSYVGQVIDYFASMLFASPFQIRTKQGGETKGDADPFYAVFREDCDASGTDLASFMKGRFTSAIVQRCAWWLAVFPEDDAESPASNLADYRERGLDRARLVGLEPWEVLDWECDEEGRLLWAITYGCEMRRRDPRSMTRSMVTETWRLYDAENVETFQVTREPARKLRPEDVVPSLGVSPHRFQRVPLVRLDLPEGLWLMNRAAEAQEEHFLLSAALSWAMKRTCYPMAIFKASDKEKPPVTGAGYLTMIGTDESFEWAAPTSAPFDVLAARIQAERTEIYRVASQMKHALPDAATEYVQSGAAKSEDDAATEVVLHAYAQHVKAAIEDTFELVSDGRGDEEVHFSIEGMTKFSLAGAGVVLANVKAAKELSIPSETFQREAAVLAAEVLLPTADQQVRDTIRKEILEADLAPKPPPSPPPAGPPGAPGAPPPGAKALPQGAPAALPSGAPERGP